MKNKQMKRLLAIAMAAATVCSFAACGNEQAAQESVASQGKESVEAQGTEATSNEEDLYYNKTGYPICDEPITITVSGIQRNSPDWNNTLLVKVVEEKLGIKLECSPFSSDAWASQYALMLSTNDIPDLIINQSSVSKSQVNVDGEDGYWLDMSEYIDIMPNLQAFFEEYPQFEVAAKTEDGSIYSLGRIAPSRVSNIYGQIYYDTTLVEAAGVGEIKTVDDFYEALKLVKKAYPDKIPLAGTFDAEPAYKVDHILRTAFGIYSGTNSALLMADDDGKVFYGELTDNYREYLKYMNKLVDEGLLDKNSFIVTKDEYYANITAGKYVFYSAADLKMVQADNDAVNNEDFSVREKYEMIYALTSDYQDKATYVVNNGVLNQARIMINAETEYPEAICRLIDFFATEEGQWLATFGVEGESFEFVDDGYGNKIADIENFWDKENYEASNVWQNTEVVINQALALNWGIQSQFLDDASEETLKKIASDPSSSNYFNARELIEFEEDVEQELTSLMSLVYTSEEADEIGTISADISNYLKTMKVSFMLGETDPYDDAAWETFKKTVYEMGYERLMEVSQVAYDRMYGSK